MWDSGRKEKELNPCGSVWVEIKKSNNFKRAYFHREHTVVMCRLIAVWKRDGEIKQTRENQE